MRSVRTPPAAVFTMPIPTWWESQVRSRYRCSSMSGDRTSTYRSPVRSTTPGLSNTYALACTRTSAHAKLPAGKPASPACSVPTRGTFEKWTYRRGACWTSSASSVST